MSFPATGTGKLKAGTKVPGDEERQYALLVAGALQADLGGSHQAVKTVMRWSGVGERTAKHWLAGSRGPGGPQLLSLIRNSDRVFETVMISSGRTEAVGGQKLVHARKQLEAMLEVIRALTP